MSGMQSRIQPQSLAHEAHPRICIHRGSVNLGQLQARSGPAAGRQVLASTDCPGAWPRGCSFWVERAGRDAAEEGG